VKDKPEYYYPALPADLLNNAKWNWAKMLVRSTAFVAAAGVHLQVGHLMWSNYPNIALLEKLDPFHPIRLLLTPHFYRSANVASKSLASLVPSQGLLHRGTTFESIYGLHRFYYQCMYRFRFRRWLDELTEAGFGQQDYNYPQAEDGHAMYKIIKEYVTDYLNLYYDDPEKSQPEKNKMSFFQDNQLKNFSIRMKDLFDSNLPTNVNVPVEERFPYIHLSFSQAIEVLSEILFRVTVWHSFIGDAFPSATDCAIVNLKTKKFDPNDMSVLLAPVESTAVQAFVTALTSMPMPTMLSTDFSYFFEANHRAQIRYKKFRFDCVEQAARVTERNTNPLKVNTDWPFEDYNPIYSNVSISV